MITVASLSKSYGKLPAVDDVSFSIEPGEAFGLLGPNGAGKSTTIQMLAGVLVPDSGEITIDGASDPTRPEVRSSIGVAPQELALYEEMSAVENLELFGALYGLRGAALRERVEWSLDFSGLADRKKDRVATFSGGMKRRLNLACAIVNQPAVLICDEPTVGIDPQSRNHIFESIEELRRQGTTLLYTTHYMEEAARLCDRIAIMDHGKILAVDTVDALIATHGGDSLVHVELMTPPPENAMVSGVDLETALDGTTLRIDCERPFEILANLGNSHLDIRELRVERPDLERVFLGLTGRSLRDS